MSLSVVKNKITPQTKAWRAFLSVATPAEKNAVMDVVSQMYADQDMEEGMTLYGLSQMTYAEFNRKFSIERGEAKPGEIASRALITAGLSFKDKALKVA